MLFNIKDVQQDVHSKVVVVKSGDTARMVIKHLADPEMFAKYLMFMLTNLVGCRPRDCVIESSIRFEHKPGGEVIIMMDSTVDMKDPDGQHTYDMLVEECKTRGVPVYDSMDAFDVEHDTSLN